MGAAGQLETPHASELKRLLSFTSRFLPAGWELAAVSSHHVAIEEAGGCDEKLRLITAAFRASHPGEETLGSPVRRLTAPAITDTAALVRSCRSKKSRLTHPRRRWQANEPPVEGGTGTVPCPFNIPNAADKACCGPPVLIGEVSPARSRVARASFHLVLLFLPPGPTSTCWEKPLW